MFREALYLVKEEVFFSERNKRMLDYRQRRYNHGNKSLSFVLLNYFSYGENGLKAVDRGLLLACLLTDMNRYGGGPPSAAGRGGRG
jgi:hypothetical protein